MLYISGLVCVLLFPKIIKVTEKRKKKKDYSLTRCFSTIELYMIVKNFVELTIHLLEQFCITCYKFIN